MIAVLALETGIAPQALWDADPRDLATLLDVREEARRRARRGR